MILFVIFLVILGSVKFIEYYGQRMQLHHHYTNLCPPPQVEATDIVFTGEELALADAQLHSMLTKRFPYYAALLPALQLRFAQRLQRFMSQKTFIIKDDEGVKDMPVLISAAAIQLSFGLKQYLLPFYKYIRIYPEEYFSEDDFFKILAGNVKNNVISIAWNHVLHGYANARDGVNTPLHEMSHALYIQKMVIDENYARDFHLKYHSLLAQFRLAYALENKGHKNLYSEYAERNPQEFWAESVELFFERPAELEAEYPQVFEAMVLLLNQDPRTPESPVLATYLSWTEKLRRLKLLLSRGRSHRSMRPVDE